MRSVSVILDNIRSVYNVGSIFRTCDAAKVDKLYLCGVTPTPLDRFGRDRKDLAKVALGAERSVGWESVSSTDECITRLQHEGIRVIAAEQDERAKDFKMLSVDGPCAFVFGEETKGLSKETLSLCDDVVQIPMWGVKESLNVAVAAGVILYGVKRS